MYAGRLAEKASTSTIVDSPLHPYTQALIASLPEVGVRNDQTTLIGIPAGRRRWSTRPPGAASGQVPFAFAKCAESPPFEEVKPGHYVACWKVSQEEQGK